MIPDDSQGNVLCMVCIPPHLEQFGHHIL